MSATRCESSPRPPRKAPASATSATGPRGFGSRGDVLQTVEGRMTTADLVSAERRLIAAAVGRAGAGTAVVYERTLKRALAAGDRPLTGEQAAAVRAVTTSGNGVDVIEALAGPARRSPPAMIRHVYEHAGYHVIGMAPTGRAVRELAEEAGIAAWTIDRALISPSSTTRGCAAAPSSMLDEAGMASTRA